MEVFDYSQNAKDLLSIGTGSLNSKEIRCANLAKTVIEEDAKEFRTQSGLEWFYVAILPVLQDFAEMTSSVLQLEADNRSVIVATLINSLGLDITQSCTCMKMLFVFANHVGINVNEGQASLSLIFDFSDYVG